MQKSLTLLHARTRKERKMCTRICEMSSIRHRPFIPPLSSRTKENKASPSSNKKDPAGCFFKGVSNENPPPPHVRVYIHISDSRCPYLRATAVIEGVRESNPPPSPAIYFFPLLKSCKMPSTVVIPMIYICSDFGCFCCGSFVGAGASSPVHRSVQYERRRSRRPATFRSCFGLILCITGACTFSAAAMWA